MAWVEGLVNNSKQRKSNNINGYYGRGKVPDWFKMGGYIKDWPFICAVQVNETIKPLQNSSQQSNIQFLYVAI